MKYIRFLFLIITQFVAAQNTVTGMFTDSISKIKSVALYQFKNGTPEYVKFTEVDKNTFTFAMDNLPSGYYKALYQNVTSGFVDFIYNKENVKFKINSKVGQPSVAYLSSRENQLIASYNYSMLQLQSKLDSVQMAFFRKPSADVAFYKEIKSKIDGAQNYYKDLAKNDYCLSLIKASKRYNAPIPYTLPGNYISSIQKHFFDYIDFKDQGLQDSDFLKKRVTDYVFYLHQSESKETENRLFISAIKKVDSLLENTELKEGILADLIQKLIAKENSVVLKETVAVYKNLPLAIQNDKLLKETEQLSKTLLRVVAPNIKISTTENLYSLSGSKNYLIVFWSSSCSHCTAEIPKVKALLKEHTEVTVVSVGLEKKEDKTKWASKIKEYPTWKNVISLGKWSSIDAKNYSVNATPSYFVLNANKRIIAKPSSLEKLQEIFQ
ncbi:thiol-disulfide isomerase/thioredoxin [Wenyingzhuangia heitensis]|uniref:Thiol-disulfide isomerase/thioredoxin n=1 Tax=Wenyingzhuangia heitensis TaxID=1487859 RepID=A0ABX0U4P2_9FLAO|nr:thioredoxin-like domain-containing protein [Wenyingzhuangia heitensis]NIJ43814.1 thiol-disulfide isomerase/thioredoxin [Wenyingzhuangia heitensis]